MRKYLLIVPIRFVMLIVLFGSLTTTAASPVHGMAVYEPEGKPDESASETKLKRIALVIDDFGNDMDGTKQMMELDVPFTAAVMPFLRTTARDAEWAYMSGRDVIVHMPMEPMTGRPEWLGPGAITTMMTDDEIRSRVHAAIDNVPHAVGMNNHMGSKVTADERVMRIVLSVCKERHLFFLDSRTTHKTVIPKLAAELQVPTARNHIFMDDISTNAYISKQAAKLQEHVKAHPLTIVIGHVGNPGKITSAVLAKNIGSIKQLGAEFVLVSDITE